MTKAERLFLTHIGDMDQVRNLTHDLEQIRLPPLLQHFLELIADIEMVLDRLFTAPSHDDDLIAASRDSLLDSVLDNRFVDQRQHFFRLRLGGWEKSGAQASGGKNSLANSHLHD